MVLSLVHLFQSLRISKFQKIMKQNPEVANGIPYKREKVISNNLYSELHQNDKSVDLVCIFLNL